MPTLDELAAQVAALQQQVSAITTPPTEYYTSIYSGEEIDAAITKIRNGPTGINPNLLDNWYFVGGGTDGKFPVNQRGQTSYNIASSYTIDRWMRSPDPGTIELTAEGLKFMGTETQNLCIAHFLDFRVTEDTVVTLSAIYRGQIILDYWGAIASPSPVIQNGWGLHTFSYIIPAGTDLSQRLYCPTVKTYLNQISYIAAVKLELGSQQTLAHQDKDGNWVLNEIPDYGEELAKCQRYCYVLDGSAYNPQFTYDESEDILIGDIPFPVTMRTSPSASLFPLNLRDTTNGTTLIVSGAEIFVSKVGLSLLFNIEVSEGGPLVDRGLYTTISKIVFSADL